MKVAKSSAPRVSARPAHQIQFDDEGSDGFADQEAANRRTRYRNSVVRLVCLFHCRVTLLLCILLLTGT